MKCRTKPRSSQNRKKYVSYAPKRGGIGYWIYIAVFAFMIPMITITTAAGIIISIIFNPINPIIILALILISPIASFFIARRSHRRLMQMPDDQYEKCFNQHYHCTVYKENVDPYDPESSIYWIYGPRGTRNND